MSQFLSLKLLDFDHIIESKEFLCFSGFNDIKNFLLPGQNNLILKLQGELNRFIKNQAMVKKEK